MREDIGSRARRPFSGGRAGTAVSRWRPRGPCAVSEEC